MLCIAVYCVMSRVYGTPFLIRFFRKLFGKLFGKDDILERCVFIMKRKRKTAREIFIVICLFLTIFLAVLFAFGRTEIPAVVYMSVCTACLFGGVAAIQE